MKILSSKESSIIDRQTIQKQNITSWDLMERAAQQLVSAISKEHPSTHQDFYIICGPGNNGGDGLAVARMLLEKGYEVHVSLLKFEASCSVDNLTNQKLLKAHTTKLYKDKVEVKYIHKGTVIIDALFGVGLLKELKGEFKKTIVELNNMQVRNKIAIDLPSGLYSEKPHKESIAFKANQTLCIGTPKLALFMPENEEYIGEWQLVQIGLDEESLHKIKSDFMLLTSNLIEQIYEPRKKFAHKGDNGTVVLHGGSLGKAGAAVLMSKACLRVGAGLVSTHIPKHANPILQSTVPEAMTILDNNNDYITDFEVNLKADVHAVGPGLGTKLETEKAFLYALKHNQFNNKLILDADALNILSKNKSYLKFLPKQTILTPHPGEFKRLVGEWQDDYERLQLLQDFAKDNQCTVVLKGHHTCIALPNGNMYFNTTGNSGMATGGSGDLLTGTIAGLLAQGYSPAKASLFGVYLHGLAGDLTAAELSKEFMLPSDMLSMYGRIFKALASKN